MKRIIKAKAAPYPKTNTKELEAVITFESLIDPNRIKPDIKIFDKIPNTDGLIEIVDLEQIPIGKIEIQIKYLNPYNYKTPKYQCDKKFLAYCEGSLLPVLLILVNTKNKIAYWHHIDKKTLISISDSILEKESISIHFSKKNFVSKKKHEYIESWIKIINNQKKKIFDYDKLENRFRQLHEEYSNINKKKLAKKAKENSIFKELHIFLDYYNNLLDGDFKTIKTILYPFYWKIGIGIIEYKETSISFILYPVRYDHNDTLIKEIGTKTRLKKEFISIVGHYYKNPIKTYPKKYSYELIEKNIENSLKQQPILPKEKIVAIEYLFAFIDKYYKLLDLDLKNKYTVTEIHNSLNNFLPLLIHLSINEKFNKNQDVIFKIKIDSYFSGINQVAFEKLKRKTIYSLKKGIKPKNKYLIETYFLNYNIALFFIEYLHSSQIKIINRLFNDEKKITKSIYFSWETFGEKITIQNIKLFYKYFPSVYDNLIKSYFPSLFNELKFYKDFDLKIIIIDFTNLTVSSFPFIECIYCSSNMPEKRIIIFNKKDPKNPIKNSFWENKSNSFKFENKIYKIKYFSRTILEFIYRESPLLTSMDELLKKRLKEYLETKKNDA